MVHVFRAQTSFARIGRSVMPLIRINATARPWESVAMSISPNMTINYAVGSTPASVAIKKRQKASGVRPAA